MKYPENYKDIIRDVNWKEWVVIIGVSAFLAWFLMFPFVDFLTQAYVK